MRTTTIFAETHTSERANHVAYRLVYLGAAQWTIMSTNRDVSAQVDYSSWLTVTMYFCPTACIVVTPSPIDRRTGYCFRSISLFLWLFLCQQDYEKKRLDRFAWNFQGRCGVTMGRPDYIFGQFRETARCRDAQHGDEILCHIKCDHPACVSASGHFEHMMWTRWSRLIWHNFVKVAGNWIKICSLA